MLTISQADIEQMLKVEKSVEALLLARFKGNTEPMLLAFALVRLARQLAHVYPPGSQVRKSAIAMMAKFLEDGGEPDGSGLLVDVSKWRM